MKRVEMYYYPCVCKDGTTLILRHWEDVKKYRKQLGIIDFICCGSESSAQQWIYYSKELVSNYDDTVYPVCYTSFKTVPSSNQAIYGYIIKYKNEILKEVVYTEKYKTFAYPNEGYVIMLTSLGEYILKSKFNRSICIVTRRHLCHLLTGWSILSESPVSYRNAISNFRPYENLFSFRIRNVALQDPVFRKLEFELVKNQAKIRGRHGCARFEKIN